MTIAAARQQIALLIRVENDLLTVAKTEEERHSIVRTIQALEVARAVMKTVLPPRVRRSTTSHPVG